jgi:hypothetical protein
MLEAVLCVYSDVQHVCASCFTKQRLYNAIPHVPLLLVLLSAGLQGIIGQPGLETSCVATQVTAELILAGGARLCSKLQRCYDMELTKVTVPSYRHGATRYVHHSIFYGQRDMMNR